MEKDPLCMTIRSTSYKYVIANFVRLILIMVFACCQSILATNARLSRPSHCPGQMISWTSRYQSFKARSVLECASVCRPDVRCVAVVFEAGSSLCYFSDSTVSDDCSNAIMRCDGCKYYEVFNEVVCENGGTPSHTNGSCTCPLGYYGDTCNISYADCHQYVDERLMGQGQKGVYFIKPPTVSTPFPVFCDYLLNQNLLRIYIATRKDLTANFNLSWQEYQHGFGDLNSNTYWMGLEKIHHLTNSRQYQLRFRVKLEGTGSKYQFYENISVGNETNGYALTFLTPTVSYNLGDCLTSELLGAKFSTYDRDQDDSNNVHCALQHGSGWWFRGDNCSSCNPFGPILSPFNGTRKGVPGEAFWIHKLGDVIPFSLSMYLVSIPSL